MNYFVTVSGLAAATLLVCGVASAQSERFEDGHKAYTEHCASCHDKGVNGAPSIQNQDDWADRSNLWDAVLFEHANSGYLNMPAKGGNENISEYSVDAAAEYMLYKVYPELPRD
jgi:cytochrome c5